MEPRSFQKALEWNLHPERDTQTLLSGTPQPFSSQPSDGDNSGDPAVVSPGFSLSLVIKTEERTWNSDEVPTLPRPGLRFTHFCVLAGPRVWKQNSHDLQETGYIA